MVLLQETILKLEGKGVTVCDLFTVMNQLRELLKYKADDRFFGMKANMAFRKKITCLNQWFISSHMKH